MENKALTAVEWLAKALESYGDPQVCEINWKDLDSLVEQAKQMEKEQIVEAFYEGMKTNPFDPNRGRGTMYYNEQYGQGSPDTTSPNTQNK